MGLQASSGQMSGVLLSMLMTFHRDKLSAKNVNRAKVEQACPELAYLQELGEPGKIVTEH